MLKGIPQFPTSALILAAAFTLYGGSAQAQGAQQPSNTDKNGCQANTTGANGNANETDLDGTYSACSLVNGFIGIGMRTNDGTHQASDFGLGESDQVLRHPQFGSKDHRLTNLMGQQDGSGSEGGLRVGRGAGEYRFNTRDFVSVQENKAIVDTDGYHGTGHMLAGTDSDYLPLLTAASRGIGTPAGGLGGVGGGGVTGGIDSGSEGSGLAPPITPAVPEPQTWAMMIAGLGLLVFAGRQKASRKA